MTPPRLYRPKRWERVEVVWVDAQHDTVFDGDPTSYEGELAKLEDIGYFVKMTKASVILCSCRDMDTETARHMLTIPRALVREIRPLDLRGGTPDAV